MKSDFANFFGRALGRLLMIVGIFLGGFIAIVFNIWVGFIIGLAIVIYGKYLVFKADRRYGYVMYNGGNI